MHIRNLRLTNFRGAREVSLDLDARLNVFVGVNGVGKTTILEAAVMLLSWFVNRIRNPQRASGRPITEMDITNGKPGSRLAMQLDLLGGDYACSLAKTRNGRKAKVANSSMQEATQAAHKVLEANVGLPLVAYYSVNRAVLDIPLRIRRKQSFHCTDAYDDALTRGTNFRTFFEWYREKEDLENENISKLTKKGGRLAGYEVPELEAVRCALSNFMPGFKNLSVSRSPLRMEVEKQGQLLRVNQLSDGEKCLMAMVGDLARRLAIANEGRPDPLAGAGIIMIDELDLHLHPQGQRELVPRLRKTFKNCQFLVATHPPHVITHVQPDNIFLLHAASSGLEVTQPSESYGKTAESILEDLMGLETTRPKKVNKQLQHIGDLIAKGEFQPAEKCIESLKADIGSDPELVKASVFMHIKQGAGK